MTTPARKMRLCDVCGGYDDHPRHVTGLPEPAADAVPDQAFLEGLPDGIAATAIAELMDPFTYVRHMDCCQAKGCASCREVLAAVGDASGDALITALESGVADHLTGQ